ncbi:MAG: hypothetical protein Q8Q39_04270 [bacterium]|nr:hypothetical protein [bacterium]
MGITDGFDVITTSFETLWLDFFSAVPKILGAILVIVIGWAIAMAIGKLVASIVANLKLDEGLEKMGFKEGLERAGLHLDSSAFLGGIFQWTFVVVSLLAAANILELEGVTAFLQEVLLYVPNLIVAIVMIIAATLLARFFEKLVHASMETAKLHGGDTLGSITKWAILLFGYLAAVQQLGVAEDIINIVVTGVVAMIALGGGIAFGIAGKDFAAGVLKKMERGLE